MHAALITGKGAVELVEFPDPVPVDEGVVVDIAFCGVCGTDVHAYQSGRPYNPAICGHEWAGTISAVGRDVRSLGEGDRVVVAAAPACGQCTACHAGHAERCQQAFMTLVGRDALAPKHGGFAPQIAVGSNRVVRTNPALTDEQAAQVEPATVAFHAVRGSRLRLGDTAVVQGAGPIGLSTLQFVRAGGAGRIIVIEPNADRRALAAELGAHDTVEPGDEARQLIDERTQGPRRRRGVRVRRPPGCDPDRRRPRAPRWVDVPHRAARREREHQSGSVADEGDHRHLVARLLP